MLTREEGIRVVGAFVRELIYLGFSLSCAHQSKLYDVIDSFIEKPKPCATIGYYYKDGHGNIERVTAITPIRIVTNYGNFYQLDGTEFEGIDERDALDLSIAYKLVEIEE